MKGRLISGLCVIVTGFVTSSLNAQSYNLSSDFSFVANPTGVWSYGSQNELGGPLSLFSGRASVPDEFGLLVDIWFAENAVHFPQLGHNPNTTTAYTDGGAGVFPPGSVWFHPGYEGFPENFGVVRFTTPLDGGGVYSLQTAVRTYLDGPSSGDSDFHVALNGADIFLQFLPGDSSASYTNTLSLAAGDTIDFLVGRGLDGSLYASGLKIEATLSKAGKRKK